MDKFVVKRARLANASDTEDRWGCNITTVDATEASLPSHINKSSETVSAEIIETVLRAEDNSTDESDDSDVDSTVDKALTTTKATSTVKMSKTKQCIFAKHTCIQRVTDGYFCSLCRQHGMLLKNKQNDGVWIVVPLPLSSGKKLYKNKQKSILKVFDINLLLWLQKRKARVTVQTFVNV